MEARHLIDGIVRQTTVLIAELSTVAGIRAPLSRIADEVFLSLSRELESQGVTRKVAADMFGLALRSYQLKINRLTASAGTTEHTLWEMVIEHLRASAGCTRASLMARFAHDEPADVGAVLKDLVDSGLVSRTGRGEQTYYQLASNEAAAAMAAQQNFAAMTHLIWLEIYDRQQVTRAALLEKLRFLPADAERAIDELLRDGRVRIETSGGTDFLVCRNMAIPVGSELGWEAAVFDHFRAVATAIAIKLRKKGPHSRPDDVVGGTTLTFSIRTGHPFEEEVYGLLARVRKELNEVWRKVADHNLANPIDPDARTDVTFYFGQSVMGSDREKNGS